MTDDTDNLRLLALAATSRPMVAPGVSYAEGAALLRLLDRVEASEAERDELRALLREALPELLGEFWDETRYCRTCLGYDGHKDDCLVPRIDAALGGEAQ